MTAQQMAKPVVFLLLFTGLSSSLLAHSFELKPQEQLQPKTLVTAPTVTAGQESIALTSQLKYDETLSRFFQLILFTLISLVLALNFLRSKKRKVFLSQALASGQASHDQMQWLMAVLDNFPGMVLISDANGKPMLANKAYNTCVQSGSATNPDSIISVGNSQSDEYAIADKYYRISREVIRHNDGHEYHITVFADFTELKQRKQELKLSQQQAVDALKARESFLGIISHELRTPLAAMIGLMELLKPELKSTQNQELMKNAQASAERLKALVNDILDFSKMEADQLLLDIYQGNIFDELGSMLRTLEAGARVKGLEFIVDWQPTRLCHAKLDWLRLSQLVNNLVSNAIKFTQQGLVKVSVSNTEQQLYLSIEDSGCGMTSAQLLTLFQPFVQGDPSINRNYGGSGLGMSIVEHLVQLMGGEIKVQSQHGQGTQVCVSLPAVFHPLTQAIVPDVQTQNDKLTGWLMQWGVNLHQQGACGLPLDEFNLSSNIYPDLLLNALCLPNELEQHNTPTNLKYAGKVLVADDDPINRFLFQKQLKKLGLEVVTVNDGLEALDYLTHHLGAITLLITDCHMPNLNGYDLVRKLRAKSEFKALPIIGCTAEDSRLVAEKAQCVGMDELIYKPYSFYTLSTLLGRYCRLQPTDAGQDKLDWLNEYEIEEQLEFSAVVRDSLIADKAQLVEQAIPLAAICHRIKGAANALNLHELASLAYACETVSAANASLATKRLVDEIDCIITAINNWLSKQYL
ncbi:hybrid sensor histidine kinase/response regulator [Shewanella pealeana]|uniref:histidine kinase n=1 Tax=Shewanella pealeana (strain ATCC 700345 / ANG-SQ1) TaxID=398579 RepID=A8H1R7_SHEPA|nr:ATP-binding protein [Shewanella pealeana]ABV86504.1 Hpt sensor hybrid histidine kinase [Shewanella pealeana ATCC 700345]